MHGGCYVLSPGEAGLPEGLMMAGFGGFKVISVDYRMPPDGVLSRPRSTTASRSTGTC